VRGPSIFKGYWNKPAETAAVFTPDGFFCTGDIAKLEDGFLWITDRKKELIKTSNGKFIAPQPIENKLKANTLVGTAALVGDRQKFVAALLSPNFAALEDWAKAQGIAAGDRAALVKDARVVAEYKAIIDKVNKTLAPFELIKRICVVADEWSVETDELTPSMKLKRRVVEKRYAAEIRGFYGDEAAG
jgi:long-chain acyl-CoA synthetase